MVLETAKTETEWTEQGFETTQDLGEMKNLECSRLLEDRVNSTKLVALSTTDW